jgi:hypothetical protein
MMASLRVYADQMRDVQYARGRYTNLKAHPANLYGCTVCGVPPDFRDHHDDHGYVRGPLAQNCNSNDNWAVGCYRLPEAFCPMEHVRRRRGCAAAGPGLKVCALVVQRASGHAVAVRPGPRCPQPSAYARGVRSVASTRRIMSALKLIALPSLAWLQPRSSRSERN